MKKTLNTGIIGFGNSGQTFLAPFIAASPGFDLKKISTSDPAKTEKARSVYPGVEVVGDADQIIDDPNIELVSVSYTHLMILGLDGLNRISIKLINKDCHSSQL